MIAEAFVGALVGLGVNQVYRAARRAYDRCQSVRSDREILDEIGSEVAALRESLDGQDAKLAGTVLLAARSLAPAADRLTAAVAGHPSASQGELASQLVHEVLERARATIEHEGPERATGDTLEVPPPAPPRDLTGTVLSGYRLERRLGSGGFGAVYLGTNAAGMVAAIKVPHHAGQVRRVLKEARALAALAPHPGIVRLLHLSLDDPAHLVFEHVEGRTLREVLLDEGPLDEERAREVLAQALRALEHAHAGGVLHLDLKPENLMLAGNGPDPVVKVLDFGLGRPVSQASASLAHSMQLSRAGTVAGTPAYMAPEQLDGAADLDARADLFALGIVAFELLTGKTPVGNARLRNCSEALASFHGRACAYDREDRPSGAGDALRLLVDASLPDGSRHSRGKRKRQAQAASQPMVPVLRAGDWCHVEIPVTDRERAKRFYGQAFGWTFQDAPGLEYTRYCTHEGVAVGGGLFNPPPGVPRHWMNYVLVDRIEDAVAGIEQAGGRLINPKMEVQETGWFALVADPDGNVFGLWQSRRP